MIALLDGDVVRAPAPGWFRRTVAADHLVAPGDVIGELEVLGRLIEIIAPQVRGLVKLPAGGKLSRQPVSYGDELFRVEAGRELAPGATVCLLEVMMTFHRVTYDGARAKVRVLLVADGADVNQGDPLLALDPA